MTQGSLGVDISTHNGSVDFNALKQAGVKFAIIRCGYGNDIRSQDDDRFEQNVQKAIAAKMPYGVYLYSYATNLAMARSEGRHALRLLNGRAPELGVWFDIEDPSQVPLSSDLKVAMCKLFCEEMEQAGQFAGIYSSLSWFNGPLASHELDRYAKWVAQWNRTFDYDKPAAIWQFTDELVINGKNFDGNRLMQDIVWPVKAKHWYDDAVNYVKSVGLMVGDGNGFRPNDNITRAEVAQILYNMSKK